MWLENKVFFANNSIHIKISRYRVQDIDNKEDLIKAESFFNLIKLKNIKEN